MISKKLGKQGAFERTEGPITIYIFDDMELYVNDVSKIQKHRIPELASYNGSFEINLLKKKDGTFWNVVVYTESDTEMLNMLIPSENVYGVKINDLYLSA